MLTLKYKSSLFATCLAVMVGMGMFSACGQDDIQNDEIQDEISEPIDSATMLEQTDSGESYDVIDYIYVDNELVPISDEEYAAYDLGDYEFIRGEMSYEELQATLAH